MEIMKSYLKEKNIELSSFGWSRIRDIERSLDRGEISKSDVEGKLRNETSIRLAFDRNDYKKIEEQLKRRGL